MDLNDFDFLSYDLFCVILVIKVLKVEESGIIYKHKLLTMKLANILKGLHIHGLFIKLGPFIEVVFMLQEDHQLVVGVNLFFFAGATGVNIGKRFEIHVFGFVFEKEF